MKQESLPLLHVAYTLNRCDMVPHCFTKTIRWDVVLDTPEAIADLEKFLLLTTANACGLGIGQYSFASIENWKRLER
jgi:hypothetical protein